MNAITRTDRTGYIFLGVVFAASLYLGFTNPDYFNNVFTVEDGSIEWGTAIMLFCVSFLSLYHLFTLWSSKPLWWKVGTLLFALLFFFGAGEEISWGQRIFGIESGEFFRQNNAQHETNLHNLVVGETKINKVIFSQLLMIVMVIYLIVFPFLYRKGGWIKDVADTFAIPVVKWHHTITFLACTALVAINPADRKWEVYEFAFGVIFFLIFLNPFNSHIFKKS